MQDLAPPFIKLHEGPVGPFTLKMTPDPPGVLATTPSFHLHLYHLQMCWGYALSPIVKVINEDLNGIERSIYPWGLPLVTGLQMDFVLLVTALWAC